MHFCFDPLGRRQFKVHPANLLDINIIQNSHNLVYLSRPHFRPTSWHPTISVNLDAQHKTLNHVCQEGRRPDCLKSPSKSEIVRIPIHCLKQIHDFHLEIFDHLDSLPPPGRPKSPRETKILRTTIQGQKRILDSH